MAYSSVTYIGDGFNDIYNVPFEYIKKADVDVAFNGVGNVPITWVNDSSIKLPYPSPLGVEITISRRSRIDAREVVYQDAIVLTKESMDKDSNQSFMLHQEVRDDIEAIEAGMLGQTTIDEITANAIGGVLSDPQITALTDEVDALLAQDAEGSFTTYYQDAYPNEGRAGDFWVDTNDGNNLWRHNGNWVSHNCNFDESLEIDDLPGVYLWQDFYGGWVNTWTMTDNADEGPFGPAGDTAQTISLNQNAGGIAVIRGREAPLGQGLTHTVSFYIRLLSGTIDKIKISTNTGTYVEAVSTPTQLDGTWQRFAATCTSGIGQTAVGARHQGVVDLRFEFSGTPTFNLYGLQQEDGTLLHPLVVNGAAGGWIDIQDGDIGLALEAAGDAQATADSKIVTFFQDDEPASPPAAEGDLWFDTDDNNKQYRYDATLGQWVLAQDQNILAALAGVDEALTGVSGNYALADSKIVTYFDNNMPSIGTEGDLWIDTSSANNLWRHSGNWLSLCSDFDRFKWENSPNGINSHFEWEIIGGTRFSHGQYAGPDPSTPGLDTGDWIAWYGPSTQKIVRHYYAIPEDAGLGYNVSVYAKLHSGLSTMLAMSGFSVNGGPIVPPKQGTFMADAAAGVWVRYDADITSTYGSIGTSPEGDSPFFGYVDIVFTRLTTDTTILITGAQVTSGFGVKQFVNTDTMLNNAWVDVVDGKIGDALSAAADAQNTADGKIITFFQDNTPTAGAIGDLWFDTNDQNHMYRWNGSTWMDARDVLTANAWNAAQSAQTTADGKIVTFVADNPPTADGVGDLWIDSNDDNKMYRWSGTAWDPMRDQGIADALADAFSAQSTADGKVTTFYVASGSPPTPEGDGDLWFKTDTEELVRWNLGTTTWELVSTVGATWGINIQGQPANSALLNSAQEWVDIQNKEYLPMAGMNVNNWNSWIPAHLASETTVIVHFFLNKTLSQMGMSLWEYNTTAGTNKFKFEIEVFNTLLTGTTGPTGNLEGAENPYWWPLPIDFNNLPTVNRFSVNGVCINDANGWSIGAGNNVGDGLIWDLGKVDATTQFRIKINNLEHGTHPVMLIFGDTIVLGDGVQNNLLLPLEFFVSPLDGHDYDALLLTNGPADAGATYGANWDTNIAQIPDEWIYNNDDASALGFNPTFSAWPTDPGLPTGWTNASGMPTATRETTYKKTGKYAVRHQASGDTSGRYISHVSPTFATPLPLGATLQGTVEYYVHSYTGTGTGNNRAVMLVRCYTAADNSTYKDTHVPFENYTVGAWYKQKWSARAYDTATKTHLPIYAVRIYLMWTWGTNYNPPALDMTVDNLYFTMVTQDWQDIQGATKPADNADVTLEQLGGSGYNLMPAQISNFEATWSDVSEYAAMGGSGTISQDDTTAYFGTKSFKIASTATDHFTTLYGVSAGGSYPIFLDTGRKWMVSFYCKSTVANSKLTLRMVHRGAGTVTKLWSDSDCMLTNSATPGTWVRMWALFNFTNFTTPVDHEQWRMRFDNSSDVCTVNIDCIMIEEQLGDVLIPSPYYAAYGTPMHPGWLTQPVPWSGNPITSANQSDFISAGAIHGDRITAGSITADRCTINGGLTALSADFGTMNATGQVTMYTTAPTTDPRLVLEAGNTYPLWYGSGARNDANGLFYVKSDGSAAFKGDITGASGSFTGDISGASGAFVSTLDIGGADATSFHVDVNGNLWSGAATFAGAPFKVDNAGNLTATTGTFSGVTLASQLTGNLSTVATTGAGGWNTMNNNGSAITIMSNTCSQPKSGEQWYAGGTCVVSIQNTVGASSWGYVTVNLNLGGVVCASVRTYLGASQVATVGLSGERSAGTSGSYNISITTNVNSWGSNPILQSKLEFCDRKGRR